ncbi:MAG: hypothetical protein AB7F89_16815, partial [Pirellulaceae bacterium]
MIRVAVSRLEPGMVLARPVPHPQSARQNLLPRQQRLSADDIAMMRKYGVLEVWVRHRTLEYLEQRFDEEVTDHQREIYAHVRRNFETLMHGTAADLNLKDFERAIA